MVGQEPEEYRPRRAWVEDPDDSTRDGDSSKPDSGSTPDSGDTDSTRVSPAVSASPDSSESADSAKPKIDDSLFRPGSASAEKSGPAVQAQGGKAQDPRSGQDDHDETRLTPKVPADSTTDGSTAGKTSAQSSGKPLSKAQKKKAAREQANATDETQVHPAAAAATSQPDSSTTSDTAKTGASSNDTLVQASDQAKVKAPGKAKASGNAKAPQTSKRSDNAGRLGGDSEEATAVLPRTARARNDDDAATDAKGSRLGPRSRMALLVGAVAAVVVLGLAVGYAVISLNGNGEVAGPGDGPPTAAGTDTSSAAPPEDSSVALNDASMLTSKDAKLIDSKRTWKVAQTQKGKGDDSPQTACTTNDPVEGQPNAQQTFLRTLTASGSKAPAVLHQAEAFGNADEATQAFTLAAKALGGCAMDHAYVDSGVYLSGLGNQSTGVVVNIKDDQSQFRTVLLSRTGRVVNTLDVARDDKAVGTEGVAKALGQVTNDQCTAAIGLCATNVKVSAGPPPIGGDQPGFLAAADIPPVDGQDGIWSGDTPGEVKDLFSGCEGLEFNSVEGATKRQARTYLLAENTDVPESFGLDQVLLTMKKDSDAKDLMNKVIENLTNCSDRSLTATVEDAEKVTGTGSKGTKIKGSVTTVSQKVNASTTAQYRVGITQAGSKIIYTFLPTTTDFDFTDKQWKDLNVRAGERATQVK